MDPFSPAMYGESGFPIDPTPSPTENVIAPSAVQDWLDSLKLAKDSQFTFTVERELSNGQITPLPALRNQTLNYDEIGRRYGPGVYRSVCEWRRSEWKNGKVQRQESPWFVVPAEFMDAHEEWKLEQEQIKATKQAARSAGAGVQVVNQSAPVRELVELARTMVPERPPQGDSGLGAAMLQLGQMQMQMFQIMQSQSMEMMRLMQKSQQDNMALMVRVLDRPDPRLEIHQQNPQLPGPQSMQEQVKSMANTYRELKEAFGDVGGDEPSGIEKVVNVLTGLVASVGPMVLKSMASMPGPVTRTVLQSRPAVEQASMHFLQHDPEVQNAFFHNLAQTYGPDEARKLMQVATGTRVEFAPDVVEKGVQELAQMAPSADTDIIPGNA